MSPSDHSSIAILQIIPRLDTGGAELSTVEMTEAIAGAGARPLIASEGGRLAAEIERLGGTLIPFPAATKNPARIVANARALQKLIRAHGIRILHARSRAPAWSALLAARSTGVPLVTTYHGAYTGQRGPKLWYNSVMARGDVVIANSNYTGNQIRKHYGITDQRVTVIPRGVDLRRFSPELVNSQRVADLVRSWGLEPDRPIILQAARLSSRKGQRVVVEAASLLKNTNTLGNAVFVLAGDVQGRDEFTSELRAMINAMGLENDVRLVGHCADMAAASMAARVAVLASIEPEGFGRTSVEAMAMGCPVIATRIGATPETLLTGPDLAPESRSGWLVEPGDPLDLAAAIKSALSLDPAVRQAMGETARRHVITNYSALRMQLSTLAVYDGLLGTRLASAYQAVRDAAEPVLFDKAKN